MAKQVADEKHEDAAAAPAPEPKPHCGIIMPISDTPNYPPKHWLQVRQLIIRAAKQAGFTSSMVSENSAQDMIHDSIVKNIYHNEVVVCDVSSLNPNVMVELGLRMATMKPLVLVFDGEHKYPFDINNFIRADYPKGLHFFEIENFVNDLADKLKQVYEADKGGSYKPFLSHFNDVKIEASKLDTNTLTIVETLTKLAEDVRSLKADSQRNSLLNLSKLSIVEQERPVLNTGDLARIRYYVKLYNAEFGDKVAKEELENMVFKSMMDDYIKSNPGLSPSNFSKHRKLIEPLIRSFAQRVFDEMGVVE